MPDTRNMWHFVGKVESATVKQAGQGAITTVILKRWDDTAKKKDVETVCVCETWERETPQAGDIIDAWGRNFDREYQGKYYPRRTLDEWTLKAREQPQAAPQAQAAQQPEPAREMRPAPVDPQPELTQRQEAADAQIPF